MKGIKGMLASAKALAIEKGIRCVPTPDDKVAYGYLLKADELRHVFKLEGFRSLKTEDSYVQTWLELDQAIKVEWRAHPPVYFFVLYSADAPQIRALSDLKVENESERTAETNVYVGLPSGASA